MTDVRHPEDLALARRIAAGEDEAAETLVKDLGGELMAFARRMLGDASLAEDAFQEAALGALRTIGNYQGQASLKSWMYGILRHKIHDALRKRGRQATVSAGPDDPEMESFQANGHWKSNIDFVVWDEDAEVLQVVLDCIEALPTRQREALLMKASEGMSAAEVAEVLETNALNVRQILHRARQAVRRCADGKLEPAA